MAWAPSDEVGESDPLLPGARKYLSRFSYGAKLKGTTGQVIDPDYLEAQRQFKNNVHFDVVRGKRAGPDVDPNSPAFDWAAKKQMGLLGPTAPTVKPYIGYNFTGTWGAYNNGFGWDVLERLNGNRADKQGLGYNTGAFLSPDPSHSYIDMCNEGANEFLRLALPTRQKKLLFPYSGGCGAAVEALRRWPADRRDEIVMVGAFGDPNRPPGVTLLGNDPGGHGISEDFPPDWILNRYYSFALPGDMYPNAEGLLPIFYDILVRLEATPEFALWFFQLLVGQLGNLTSIGSAVLGVGGSTALAGFGQLAGLLPLITGGQGDMPNLVAMLFNIPAIIASLLKLLNFLITQDHSKYGATPAFDGMTAVDKCAQIANQLIAA